MRVIGVELSGNDANICLLSLAEEVFQIPDCHTRKLSLPKNAIAKDLRYFQKTFAFWFFVPKIYLLQSS